MLWRRASIVIVDRCVDDGVSVGIEAVVTEVRPKLLNLGPAGLHAGQRHVGDVALAGGERCGDKTRPPATAQFHTGPWSFGLSDRLHDVLPCLVLEKGHVAANRKPEYLTGQPHQFGG